MQFSRKWNLARHRETKHPEEAENASGEVIMDGETVCYRAPDVFDEASTSSYGETDDQTTEPLSSSEQEMTDGDSMMSHEDDEEGFGSEEGGSVSSSQTDHSTTETDDDDAGSATSSVRSDTTSSSDDDDDDESEEQEETLTDAEEDSDEEKWTLYRDWTIQKPPWEATVPQRVIKETRRGGKTFYFVEFAALPRYSFEIDYSKKWISEQALLKDHGYLVLT